jgi:hypothetical protein
MHTYVWTCTCACAWSEGGVAQRASKEPTTVFTALPVTSICGWLQGLVSLFSLLIHRSYGALYR